MVAAATVVAVAPMFRQQTFSEMPIPDTVTGPSSGTPAVTASPRARDKAQRTPARRAVDVAVAGFSRSLLSYHVPDGMVVNTGDAVEVPFGTHTRTAVVAGTCTDLSKPTRELLGTAGFAACPATLKVCAAISTYHFVPLGKVLDRVIPTKHVRATPVNAGPVVLSGQALALTCPQLPDRAVVAPAPKHNQFAVAAAAAAAAAQTGQVLMLCASTSDVLKAMDCFVSGAARVDAKGPAGAWAGFRDGTVRIAVGTRACALFDAPGLAAIVVLDEGNGGHVAASAPFTHSRDVALSRARAARLQLVLVSRCPSVQAMHACELVTLTDEQAGQPGWPRMVEVVDRSAVDDPALMLVPPRVRSVLRSAAKVSPPVVVASRSMSVRRCVSCSFVRTCDVDGCTSPCRHTCTDVCPSCHATSSTRVSGWDPPRLRALFGSGVQVVTASALEQVRDASAVVVFDVDVLLAVPGVVPGAAAARLIAAAAAACSDAGRLVVVTSDVSDPLIGDVAVRRDLVRCSARGVTVARRHRLPPFGRLVTVTLTRKTPPNVRTWPGLVSGPTQVAANKFEVVVRIATNQLTSLAPLLEPLSKRKGNSVHVL